MRYITSLLIITLTFLSFNSHSLPDNYQKPKDKVANFSEIDFSENLKDFLKANSIEKNYKFSVERNEDNYTVTIKANRKTVIKKVPNAYVNDLFQSQLQDKEQIESRVLNIIFKPGPKYDGREKHFYK